ncbi:MAG: Methyltransferase type 11 [Candidatus Shapirobacteria bacterium GW2011_GWE1_38_10]|uniref:Methyltransferase type 11 n=1 Tax=Candidatus Shapirobacteria bacterium GW2011_GWE1_38_10 TaxID=1618488 RepID=A0A0G0I749_9BACT|nr:MAG: Methyltransferase type 11 [Candidatus Shapirobacteria bacterium GW2011_GWF2_37_20]KKQ50377.1 MAG: Methyltransferase type 11 [Candidatus Shapirobacteria bacterium GW2011_GWE1_38_10]KKQ65201.1 MAG: Methyltransferase type 11 [Candidatus Shapirobacteria bacterium GW2011_GWF1_38_23]HBP51305.1 hypothetical protein [Candidatus Shapirobacteria bacterium]
MKKCEYVKMHLLEDSHFWFVGKRFFIKTYLDKITSKISTILDIGSGTGGTTKLLEKYGKVIGIEKNSFAQSLSKKRGLEVVKGKAEKLPFKKNSFDLVTILDVLYHRDIKNINKVIKETSRVLKPKGFILITDSAFSFLQGNHSSFVYEKRRFTVSELKKILYKNGFITTNDSYVYFSIFPFVFLKRTIIDLFFKSNKSDVSAFPKIVNLLLISILRLESLLLNYVKLPIGSSLIILGQKHE